ncbi:unnamed protein product [Rhizophagus irregularis]|uniref:Uncharacterized protein n=1 Tax=Rhizophagus irregularis TaxID=588596 RepID=A0A915Z429_9GLOM|nr:unnamed protein product [Rhizophagus irregularis]
MKSRLDSEICQKRKKCYPVKWFDRQLAFQFEFGEFECGDSGASVLDKQGKALDNKNDCERLTPPPSYLSSNVQNDYSRVNKRNMDINVETYNNPKRSKIDQKDL